MSTTASLLQKLLIRNAATGRKAMANFSSSLAAASSAAARPVVTTIASTAISPYRGISVRNMMMLTNTSTTSSSNSSPLDSILDPSAPASLFGSPEDEEEPVPAVLRSNKFLKCGISENVLRFKTQSYGRLLNPPYVHANEHRVMLLVRLDDLPLSTPLEHDMLEEIVGSQRYNREHNVLRLQSVQFASRIENKRHLVSMLDRLVLSCQTLAKQVMEDEGGEIKDAV
jgi:Mitochondrial ribosomal subunit protein